MLAKSSISKLEINSTQTVTPPTVSPLPSPNPLSLSSPRSAAVPPPLISLPLGQNAFSLSLWRKRGYSYGRSCQKGTFAFCNSKRNISKEKETEDRKEGPEIVYVTACFLEPFFTLADSSFTLSLVFSCCYFRWLCGKLALQKIPSGSLPPFGYSCLIARFDL
ncbi:hypothetical protein AAHA92_20826 [Salvia divinorum]|uniref:Uncharacterized protein n=1 Tax=Salvia divinorum TaxID=28513 RepID=A0ABD1GLU1_SALDI